MNRGTQRALLREEIMDVEAITWSDSSLNRRLNLAADSVLGTLVENSVIRYGRAEYEFTPNSGSVTTPLAINDFHSPLDLQGGFNDVGGKYEDERSFKKLFQEYRGSMGQDRWNDGYVYTIVPGALGAFSGEYSDEFDTGTEYSIQFLTVPAASTFKLVYRRKLSEIPDGVSYDTMSYLQMPERYHDLIVRRAAAQISGIEGLANMPFLLASSAEDVRTVIRDSRNRAEPGKM
jgi:hypothetical protein